MSVTQHVFVQYTLVFKLFLSLATGWILTGKEKNSPSVLDKLNPLVSFLGPSTPESMTKNSSAAPPLVSQLQKMGSCRKPRPRFMSSPVLTDLPRFLAARQSLQFTSNTAWNKWVDLYEHPLLSETPCRFSLSTSVVPNLYSKVKR